MDYTLELAQIETAPELPRGLGRHVEHDSRSRSYEFDSSMVTAIKSVRHTRAFAALDQGSVGACTGFSMMGAIATDPLWGGARDALPSLFDTHDQNLPAFAQEVALDLYREATVLDPFKGTYEPDDTGSTGNASAKAAREKGLIAGYQWCFGMESMLKALQLTPVTIGTNWYDSMYKWDTDGVLSISPDAVASGGHQYEVVEYDADRGLFGCWNSWGAGFGLGGYFYLTLATMDRLLGEKGDVTVPLPLAAPVPAPVPVPEVPALPTPQDLIDVANAAWKAKGWIS